jgi:aminomethyltransferase
MNLKRTNFFDRHVSLGAKIVSFAGYEMPIQYPIGIRAEHMRVRETVGVFDVSHMGEIIVKGKNAETYLNKITLNNVSLLENGQAQYTAMAYENAGLVDDLLIYKFPDYYLCVVNASNIEKDYNWMKKNQIDGVEIINESDDWSQLAIQGKNAEEVLQKLTDTKLNDIKYYWFEEGTLAGYKMILSKTGYTGEPGFEIYFKESKENSEKIWDAIFEAGQEFQIEAIGLGARDSLRLEKKMCLYGNDIDETTNPIEAGLAWITKMDKDDFIGKNEIIKIKEQGVNRKLCSLLFDDPKAFPRQGYDVLNDSGDIIGKITSGTISPVLGKGIAIAYLEKDYAAIDSTVSVEIRKNKFQAKIIKGAFV